MENAKVQYGTWRPFPNDHGEALEREYDFPKEKRTILGEDAQQELNKKLSSLSVGDNINAEYYLHRRYVICSGVFQRVDMLRRCIVISDKRVPLDDLRNIYREDWI